MVRLGELTVWRADCEIEPGTSGDAATRLIHENFVQEISQQTVFRSETITRIFLLQTLGWKYKLH
jgi:hypothetical protein